MAPFGAQPEGTGPLCRDTALQLTHVEKPHRARCALSRAKAVTGASIKRVLAGHIVCFLAPVRLDELPRELEQAHLSVAAYGCLETTAGQWSLPGDVVEFDSESSGTHIGLLWRRFAAHAM